MSFVETIQGWLFPSWAAKGVLRRAEGLRRRGMMAQAADLVSPLTRSDDLAIRLQSLVELVRNQSFLKDHQEVLISLDRLERNLDEGFPRGALEVQDERTQDFVQEIRFIQHTLAAGAYEGLGKFDEAINQARAAVAVVCGRRRSGDVERVAHRQYVLGVMLRRAGRMEEALAALEVALAESPTHVPSLIARAGYLHLLGRMDEAERQFASIRPDEKDDNAVAYFKLNAAWYHALRGEKDHMLQLLEEATYYWGGQLVVAYAREESDFLPYRDDPDFRACLERCTPLERRVRD